MMFDIFVGNVYLFYLAIADNLLTNSWVYFTNLCKMVFKNSVAKGDFIHRLRMSLIK